MTFANIWLGLRDDANTVVIDYLRHDEESGPYTGPVTNRAGRLFRFFSDQEVVSKLYKAPTLGGNVWHLWNINISEAQYSLQQVRDEIDWLLGQYGSQVSMVGAWKWTGEQYGTQHVWDTRQVQKWVTRRNPNYDPNEFLEDGVTPNPNYDPERFVRTFETVDEDYISGMTGTPLYPIPKTQLLNFMPDIRDEDGNVIGPATVLSNVNLLFGQAPRSFF